MDNDTAVQNFGGFVVTHFSNGESLRPYFYKAKQANKEVPSQFTSDIRLAKIYDYVSEAERDAENLRKLHNDHGIALALKVMGLCGREYKVYE